MTIRLKQTKTTWEIMQTTPSNQTLDRFDVRCKCCPLINHITYTCIKTTALHSIISSPLLILNTVSVKTNINKSQSVLLFYLFSQNHNSTKICLCIFFALIVTHNICLGLQRSEGSIQPKAKPHTYSILHLIFTDLPSLPSHCWVKVL